MTAAADAILDALAETVTRTLAEAEVIKHAEGILARATADDFEWPREDQARKSVTMTACGLEDALECHEGLRAGRIHPASEFFDLGPGRPDDALATALERVTEDIGNWAGTLVMVIREHCGEQAAAFVSGNEGGEQS